jgi:hypothetical protein
MNTQLGEGSGYFEGRLAELVEEFRAFGDDDTVDRPFV